jgi:hypothetical protein
MAYSLVDSVFDRSTDSNGFTTDAIDTTGANFLAVVAGWHGSGPNPTITDSKGNTYTGLTIASGGASNTRCRIFWVNNASPTVGSGHTFTLTGNATYAAMDCWAFSNSGGSVFDTENGAAGDTVDTLQPGSVTPAADGALILCGVMSNAAEHSINSSFIETADQAYTLSESMGLGSAYLIQTSAAPVNPTWTFGGTFPVCASPIAVFNISGGGGGSGGARRRRILTAGAR